MKREHLFRALRVDDKKWTYGRVRESKSKTFISWQVVDPVYMPEDSAYIEINDEVDPDSVGEFTGITDRLKVKIFEDDLRTDENGNLFRIYYVDGGFAVKAKYWASDLKDLVLTDELILMPLADAQTRNWLIQSTKHFGNIHDDKDLV